MTNLHEERKDNPVTVDRVYLHISNSGVTISVKDEGWGPTVTVHSNAFSNMITDFKVYTDVAHLRRLGNMFLQAADFEYSQAHPCQAG